MTKKCPRCKKHRPVTDFKKYSQTHDGLYWYCQDCIKAYSKKYKEKIEGGTIKAF